MQLIYWPILATAPNTLPPRARAAIKSRLDRVRSECLASARQLLAAVAVHETEWAARLQGEELAARKLHMALASLDPGQQQEELARLGRLSLSWLTATRP